MAHTMVFDMDGTIADFYNFPNWLGYLNKERINPYLFCDPLVDMTEFAKKLATLKAQGNRLIIVSWASKGASPSYKRLIRSAKVEWLKRMGIYKFFDEIHVVAYGTPKHKVVRKADRGFLFDDNEQVRDCWMEAKGTYTAISEVNMLSVMDFAIEFKL